jgi:hypothetical protein
MDIAGLGEGVARFSNMLHPFGIHHELEGAVVRVGELESVLGDISGTDHLLLGDSIHVSERMPVLHSQEPAVGELAGRIRSTYAQLQSQVGERLVTNPADLGIPRSTVSGIGGALGRSDGAGHVWVLNDAAGSEQAQAGIHQLSDLFNQLERNPRLTLPETGGA